MKCATVIASYFAVIITITFAVDVSAVRTRSRALYGEFCDNRSVRCDTSLSLSCNTSLSICVCMKPDNMMYDSVRGCVALAGEKCRFTVFDEYRSWKEEIMCVNNARCDQTLSICKCDRDFIEMPNGLCNPKKNYLESCETTSDCKQDLSLICENSKCICNPATSEYNDELLSCVGLAGHKCINDQCIPNAICREETRRAYYESSGETDEDYPDGHTDHTGAEPRCQCRTAFGVTSDGRCKLGYGGKCDYVEALCMDWYNCKEGSCVCKYPSHQIYDKNAETGCLSFVGGPCTNPAEKSNQTNNKGVIIECIPGAVCARQGESSRFQCVCNPGYIENGQKGCDLDYGQTCRTVSSSYTSRHSSSPSPPKCDSIGKLFCINGRCQCEDDLHVYDKSSRACKGLVGATCNVKQKGECVTGSYCQARRGSSVRNGDGDVEGICTCQDFYKEGEDRTCAPKVQQQQAGILTLKSGGRDSGRGVDEKFNSTANSIWAIFDHNEEDD